MNKLKNMLSRMNNASYREYKRIKGSYHFPGYTLYIDHVQGDPFATPSPVRCRVSGVEAAIPFDLLSSKARRIAVADFLARRVNINLKKYCHGNKGSGKSGSVNIFSGGQEVLERTAVYVDKDIVEIRIQVGLPAFGRRVNAGGAIDIFYTELPEVVGRSLFIRNLEEQKLRQHVAVVEDQLWLREELGKRGMITFIGNGSLLPRESGISDRPLPLEEAVLFQSPVEFESEMILPNRGLLKGMGVQRGVTLIVGGGYHGKSTLLKAIERGVYNHIPGDGREYVVTVKDAVKIRAEDGRYIEKVDISSFINNLPFGKSTMDFSTDDASGSTSQAANIIEAVETGTGLLLLDEDTSATNFLVRDARMQALVAKEKEPITPFIDRVAELYNVYNISTIMVIGGVGDYFEVADQVVIMDKYKPGCVTEKAKSIAAEFPSGRRDEIAEAFKQPPSRIPQPLSFPEPRRDKPLKVQAKGLKSISFERNMIKLDFVEQLVDENQTRAIASIILKGIGKYVDGKNTLKDIVREVEKIIEKYGLEFFSLFQYPEGDLALPRGIEICCALNRMRGLKVRQKK